MESGTEEKTLTPSYLTLAIGGDLKKEIDAYVEYAHKVGRQKNDPAEVAQLMLWHFLETNEEFSAWRKTRIYENSQRLTQRSWRDEAQTQGQGFTSRTVAAHFARQPQGVAGRIRVGYLHDSLHRETDAKEVAIEMLKHFVESDRDFRGWRSRREGGGERSAGREGRNGAAGAMRS